jgi:hypothetical protein
MKPAKEGWQASLLRKTYAMAVWDWKEGPKPYIRSLFKPFGIRPAFTGFDTEKQTLYIAALAVERRLHLYEVPSLVGSDTFGFVLSRQTLDTRDLQQIEADYWGEDSHEVDGGHSSPNFTPAAMLRTPPQGNAELAFITRIEGRRGSIDRAESLLRIRDLFPRPVDVHKLQTIEGTGPPGPVERGVSDATLLVGEKKVRLSFRGVAVGADRMRALAFIDGHWIPLAEIALGSDADIEFVVPETLFDDLEGMPLALRADSIKVELYRGTQLLSAEELPLNVDCPDQFHGLHMVGPVLSSLDARIAQAGSGVSMTYRDQAKLLDALRMSKLQGRGLKVTGFQSNLDQFFRRVHTGLRGHRERLRKNIRSVFTVRRTLRDLSRWINEATSPDTVLPNDECRVFVIERLAEEIENALRRSIEEVTTRAALPAALADTALASALDDAVSWVRARSENGSGEFCKQALRALDSARDSLRGATG